MDFTTLPESIRLGINTDVLRVRRLLKVSAAVNDLWDALRWFNRYDINDHVPPKPTSAELLDRYYTVVNINGVEAANTVARKYTDKLVQDAVGTIPDIIFNDRFRHLRQHGAYLNREYYQVHTKREDLYLALVTEN